MNYCEYLRLEKSKIKEEKNIMIIAADIFSQQSSF